MNRQPSEVPQASAVTVWHALDPAAALARAGGTADGLSSGEAAARLARVGANVLPKPKRTSLLAVFLGQFRNPLIYLLLAAALVSVAIGEATDAILILAVLLINAVVGTFQEWKAESSARALESMVPTRAVVLRDGARVRIASADLVPGDIVELESGDSVPADIRLLEGLELRVDEAALTGESTPVDKLATALVAPDAVVADRLTMIYAGSTVLSGRVRGVVAQTGAATEIGRIARVLAEERPPPPPLVVRLERFTRLVGICVLFLLLIIAVTQIFQGMPLAQVFFLAVALAVSAVPEGLPVAITVALSIGSNRMAARHVIVRALPAVEGLGACTIIASDKTGTLTCNELMITRVALADGRLVEVSGEGYAPHGSLALDGAPLDQATEEAARRLASAGVLCNEATLRKTDAGYVHLGDTVDVAFLALGGKLAVDRTRLIESSPELGFVPFEPHRRFSASVHWRDGATVAYVKGAAEVVLPMCDGASEGSLHRAEALASAGYRVLAVAAGTIPDESVGESGEIDVGRIEKLQFLGLVGLIDPVRPEVPDAVQRCRAAGIEVCMVTGDHPETALAIARELGIATTHDEVVTGREMAVLGHRPEALAGMVRKKRVFARVEPTQKLEIVETMRAGGAFVAVTGDGVNDAPALKTADIGVAMGKGGTDVARGAADLILADDNFSSIVAGVEGGRVAYENVRRVTLLLISTGLAEIVLFMMALFAGLPLPMFPAQLLWLNLVTNGVQHVALAFEKGDPRVLNQPPRPPEQSLFERRMIEQTILSGFYMGICAFVVFAWSLDQGMSEIEARSILILMMVLFENVHVFNCRSEYLSVLRVPLAANPMVAVAVVLTLALHVFVTYTPELGQFLRVQPVSFDSWLLILPPVLGLVVVMEAYKKLRPVPGRSE